MERPGSGSPASPHLWAGCRGAEGSWLALQVVEGRGAGWGKALRQTGDNRHQPDSWMEAPIGPGGGQKVQGGEGQEKWEGLRPLSQRWGLWLQAAGRLTAGRPRAKMEILHLLTEAE